MPDHHQQPKTDRVRERSEPGYGRS